VTICDQTVHVLEGHYVFIDPWHVYVVDVFRDGFKGTPTHVGIARAGDGVDRDELIAAAQRIAANNVSVLT
jgi:hypothetical protein